MDVDLQLSSFVDRRVEQCEEALQNRSGGCKLSATLSGAGFERPNLVRYVGTCVADVSVHLPHNTDMLVAVQKRELFVSDHAVATSMRSFVRLETRVGKHDDHSLGILVGCRYRNVLLCHELR